MNQPLPPAFELDAYRAAWPDLAPFPEADLVEHYERFGRAEGRIANRIDTRQAFAALIPPGHDSLEIGPFDKPMLAGPNVRFFDVLSTDGLRTRAAAVGADPAGVPAIHYVSPTGDLSIVPDQFDSVLSSHCLEHQPDLIHHLNQVERLLRPQGRYFALIPDKRYCFDALLPETTVADVLEAHHEQRRVHRLASVIEHRALTTHNDAAAHWLGLHDDPVGNVAGRVVAATAEFEAAAGAYVDVHAWHFTPDNIAAIMATLNALGRVGLHLEQLYPTRRNGLEFWMVLQRPA